MNNYIMFPKNQQELEKTFSTNERCRDYLLQLKFPNGYVCPKCEHKEYWTRDNGKYKCKNCRYELSVMAGTIFQDTKIDLTIWFRAIWNFIVNKNGMSAVSLERSLGISYKSAWIMLHKIRKSMIRPSREKLNGTIEVDECFIGGVASGKRGRGADKKTLVAIGVEVNNGITGRIRMQVVENASSESLVGFIENNIEKQSHVITDGWKSYKTLSNFDYKHSSRIENGKLPCVHMTISLLKRWMLGTHQGAIVKEHLQEYLDEFTFRFNRRKSKSRGLLFQRVLENAIKIESTVYKNLIIQKEIA